MSEQRDREPKYPPHRLDKERSDAECRCFEVSQRIGLQAFEVESLSPPIQLAPTRLVLLDARIVGAVNNEERLCYAIRKEKRRATFERRDACSTKMRARASTISSRRRRRHSPSSLSLSAPSILIISLRNPFQ